MIMRKSVGPEAQTVNPSVLEISDLRDKAEAAQEFASLPVADEGEPIINDAESADGVASITAEGASAEGGFDIDAALNTKGFAEFLARYENAHDLLEGEDVEAIQQRFETFKQKEAVTKDLKALFANQLKEELGIELSAEDLNAVNECLDANAIERPENITELREDIDKFNKLPSEIAALEQELKDLGVEDLNNIDNSELEVKKKELEAKLPDLKNAKEALGRNWYQRAGAFLLGSHFKGKEAIGNLKEEHGEVDLEKVNSLLTDTEKAIEDIENQIKKRSELGNARVRTKEAFDLMRGEVKESMKGIKGLQEAIKAKAVEQLEALLGGTKSKRTSKASSQTKRADEAHGFLQKIKAGSEIAEPLTASEIEAYQQRIDKALEESVKADIAASLERVKLGNGGLAKLEKSMTTFIQRQHMGSVEGAEAKAKIIGIMTEIRDGSKGNTDTAAKSLVLTRIISKLKKS